MSTTTCRPAFVLGLLLSGLVTSASADRLLLSRVRAVDGRARALLDEAIWRSVTFQRLVDAVADSDLIVYISRTSLDGTLRGALRFVGAGANGARYLLIELNDGRGDHLDTLSERLAAIATLAHELQHALEVAGATDVRDLASFEAFYGGVGAVSRRDLVDTQAAQLAGEQVYFEMTGRKQ